MDCEKYFKKIDHILVNGNLADLEAFIREIESPIHPTISEHIAHIYAGLVDYDRNGIFEGPENRFFDAQKSSYYLALSFEGYKSLCEGGDYDYMSHLAMYYQQGIATSKNEKMGEYWLDKLYMYKEGMAHKEFLNSRNE